MFTLGLQPSIIILFYFSLNDIHDIVKLHCAQVKFLSSVHTPRVQILIVGIHDRQLWSHVIIMAMPMWEGKVLTEYCSTQIRMEGSVVL